MRLLVIEDEAATRGFLERNLRKELFHVDAVADAESGVSQALAGGVDADRSASNVIDVSVSRLRKRPGPAGPLIRTVRGTGYTITVRPRAT